MALQELHSLLIILAIGVSAPLLSEWIPRIRLPLVVMEISLGILVGPPGRLSVETAASLVGAGMVSVLLFPIVALSFRKTAAQHDPGSTVSTPEKSVEGIGDIHSL
jgi:hypothetical protein